MSKNFSPGWIIFKKYVLLSTILFALHLSSFETEGDLQYGPRYLLPLIPLWFVGIKFIFEKKILQIFILILGLVSFGINLLGALYGAMYKEMTTYPLPYYLEQLFSNSSIIHPLRNLGISIILVGCLFFAFALRATKNQK